MEDSGLPGSSGKGSVRSGMSGRRVVPAFAILLVASTVFVLLLVLRFTESQDALEDVRQKWPMAAADLDPQFLQRSQNVTDDGVRKSILNKLEDFRKQSLFDDQLPLAIEIESELRESENASQEAIEDSQAIKDYLKAEKRLHESDDGLIGALTYTLLRLPMPQRLRIVTFAK